MVVTAPTMSSTGPVATLKVLGDRDADTPTISPTQDRDRSYMHALHARHARLKSSSWTNRSWQRPCLALDASGTKISSRFRSTARTGVRGRDFTGPHWALKAVYAGHPGAAVPLRLYLRCRITCISHTATYSRPRRAHTGVWVGDSVDSRSPKRPNHTLRTSTVCNGRSRVPRACNDT